MKKLLITAALLLAPLAANAQSVPFATDLHYGSTGQDVLALQEFLIDQGVFFGQATGNFYSVTLRSVKAFQKLEGISPVSGYVGPITRGVINQILSTQASDGEGDAKVNQEPVDLSHTVQPVAAPVQTTTPTTPVISELIAASPTAPQFVGSPQVVYVQEDASTKLANLSWQSDIVADSEIDLMAGVGLAIPIQQMVYEASTTFAYTNKMLIPSGASRTIQILLTANGQTTVYKTTLR